MSLVSSSFFYQPSQSQHGQCEDYPSSISCSAQQCGSRFAKLQSSTLQLATNIPQLTLDLTQNQMPQSSPPAP
jgi:hypothetical protein